MTLACPPFDWGWLGWLAPAPLFLALLGAVERNPSRARSRRARFLAALFGGHGGLGFLWGALYLLLLVPWFAAFTPIGYPCAAIYWGLLTGAVYWLTVRLIRGTPAALAVPLLASGWTLAEWLRAQGTLAFPWGTLSVTQHRNLPVLQMLDLSGAYGLTFLMALLAAALATLRAPKWRQAGVRWASVTGVCLAVCIARGEWLLHKPAPPRLMARVGLVQMSTSKISGGAEVVCESPLQDYVGGTRQAVAQGAELVLWPEAACEADLAHQASTRGYVLQGIGPSNAYLLAGSFVEDRVTGNDTNSGVMVSPRGEVLGQYAKVLIVPFGEYLPARALLGWTAATGLLPRDLTPGKSFTPLPWARGKVGASICYESAFGKVSRGFVSRGANLLAVLTSDGWAGRSAVGLQHVAFAPLRAVEERRSVARAAATGISELIDPYGRVLKSIPMFEHGVVVGDLPQRDDRTLYSYLGDWPVGLAVLVLVGAGLTAVLQAAKARASASTV
jgi:apolipoprotein N-acyltransferase